MILTKYRSRYMKTALVHESFYASLFLLKEAFLDTAILKCAHSVGLKKLYLKCAFSDAMIFIRATKILEKRVEYIFSPSFELPVQIPLKIIFQDILLGMLRSVCLGGGRVDGKKKQ